MCLEENVIVVARIGRGKEIQSDRSLRSLFTEFSGVYILNVGNCPRFQINKSLN